jgi:hypothetical protein
MASYPSILDSQTLKRLPVPDLRNIAQMQSANPLDVIPAATQPSVTERLPSLSPQTQTRMNPSYNPNSGPTLLGMPLSSTGLLPAAPSSVLRPPSGALLPIPNGLSDPMARNSQQQTLGAQNELRRMTLGGSGVQQITRPVDDNGMPTGEHVGALRHIGGCWHVSETLQSQSLLLAQRR